MLRAKFSKRGSQACQPSLKFWLLKPEKLRGTSCRLVVSISMQTEAVPSSSSGQLTIGVPVSGLPVSGLPVSGLAVSGLPVSGEAVSAAAVSELAVSLCT